MSRIRSRGNKHTEVALAKIFRREGIVGWRRQAEISGQKPALSRAGKEVRSQRSTVSKRRFRVKPDFVFPKLKLAVFVDGCFWHGCPKHGTKPKGNAKFWRDKIANNKARDRRVNRQLRGAGWRVLRIWEHELAGRNGSRLLARIIRRLHG